MLTKNEYRSKIIRACTHDPGVSEVQIGKEKVKCCTECWNKSYYAADAYAQKYKRELKAEKKIRQAEYLKSIDGKRIYLPHG